MQKSNFIYIAVASMLLASTATTADASEEKEASEPASESQDLPALGSGRSTSSNDDLAIEVNSLKRSSEGGLTSLTYTFSNSGNEDSEIIPNFFTDNKFH